MKKRFIALTALATLMSLASCGETVNPGSSVSSDGNGSSITSDVGTSSNSTSSASRPSSSEEQEEYVIQIKNYIGVKITSSKAKAKAGETITLTVALDAGYTLTALMLNSSTKTVSKVNDTTYTFTMPDCSAIITATLSVEGDIKVEGSVAVALTKEEGSEIYSARNITIDSTAYLTYIVNGKSLSVIQIDNTKCFCDIDLNYGSNNAGAFKLAGNATYDFFYDPSNGDVPCYIVRTAVTEAPKSTAAFESLFSGSVKSEPTTFPTNVKKVTYTNSATKDSYVWEDYTNGSLAKSTVNGKDKVVYKSIGTSGEGDSAKAIYSVVDNYIEGIGGNGDTTKNDDTYAFSGKYEIVDELVSGHKKYQYTKENANFDAHHYSHDVYSLDFDIHYGYRTGFDAEWNEELKDSNVTISSVNNEDGGFTTSISSYKTIDTTQETDSSVTKEKYHTEYRIEFTFNKAGAPLHGTYSEEKFDEKAYDFTNLTWLTGGQELGKKVKEMSFTYEYGEAKTDAIDFDTTPYFISRLDNLKIHNSTTSVTEGNGLQQTDTVGDYVSFDAYPETALDSWQYGVVSSSDLHIVKPVADNEPYNFKAINKGQVNLTVGNHTTNDVAPVVSVNVVNDYLISGFYMTAYGVYYDEEVYASYAYVRSGCIKRATLVGCSRNTGKYVTNVPFDCTITSSNPELVSATYDSELGVLVIDARNANVDKETLVTITLNTDTQDPDYSVTKFTIHVMPYSKPSKSLYTTWTDEADHPDDPVSLELKEYVEGDDSTYSVLKVDGKTYNVKYHYDDESGKMTATSSALDYIEIIYDSTTDQIGIFAATASWGGQDDVSSEGLLGSGYDDGEDGYVIETYYFLDRAA